MRENWDNKIFFQEAWEKIKAEPSPSSLRLNTDIDFWIKTFPNELPYLELGIDENARWSEEDLVSTQQIDIDVHKTSPDTHSIRLALNDDQYEELFSKLAEDLVLSVNNSDPSKASGTLLRRFSTWRRFLKNGSVKSLTPSEQLGLYGELKTFKFLIESRVDTNIVTEAWTGPEKAHQDFQLPQKIAIEVKSIAHQEPQHLKINSERQLDDSSFDALVIAHHKIQRQQDAGETLPEAISDLREILSHDINALENFNEKLLISRYLDSDSTKYEKTGYGKSETSYYRVRQGFPRLTESDLPSGLGNLTYVIDASACERFSVEPETIISWLTSPSPIEDGTLPREETEIEYKETAWTPVGGEPTNDAHRKRLVEELKTAIVKTVVAFLNTKGGELVIGVNDATKEITGIEPDLLSKSKEINDIDYYQLALGDLFQEQINHQAYAHLKYEFKHHEQGTTCHIKVRSSPNPVLGRAVSSDEQTLWVRRHNATISLEGNDLIKFIQERR